MTVETFHAKLAKLESKPDWAFCQKHFIAYSLNRYEVVTKKSPEEESTRLIVNCPMCFREKNVKGKRKWMKLKKKEKNNE